MLHQFDAIIEQDTPCTLLDKFAIASISLIGNRKLNQDRCIALHDKGCVLLLLADGLGGHPKSEIAAQILIDVGTNAFTASDKPIPKPQDFLVNILETANNSILKFGSQQRPPIDPRTTAVLALIQLGELFWGNVGDSRIYLFRNHQLLIRNRKLFTYNDNCAISETTSSPPNTQLNPSPIRHHNFVFNCLGSSKIWVRDVKRNQAFSLKPLDMLLLCTDGLWSQLTDAELGQWMNSQAPLEKLVTELAQHANQLAAPRSDNITFIVLRCLDATAATTNFANVTVAKPKVKWNLWSLWPK